MIVISELNELNLKISENRFNLTTITQGFTYRDPNEIFRNIS